MKKKEIIIVIVIIVITIFLAFSSKIKAFFSTDDSEAEIIISESTQISDSTDYYVNVTITGEIIVDELSIKIPQGYSYGNLIPYLQKYTNDYSILSFKQSTRFTDDTKIVIASSDTGSTNEEDVEESISINLSPKSDLIKLYGIGEKRADRIIEYRKSNRINSFEELKSLIGVSNAIIERIKEQAIL